MSERGKRRTAQLRSRAHSLLLGVLSRGALSGPGDACLHHSVYQIKC